MFELHLSFNLKHFGEVRFSCMLLKAEFNADDSLGAPLHKVVNAMEMVKTYTLNKITTPPQKLRTESDSKVVIDAKFLLNNCFRVIFDTQFLGRVVFSQCVGKSTKKLYLMNGIVVFRNYLNQIDCVDFIRVLERTQSK